MPDASFSAIKKRKTRHFRPVSKMNQPPPTAEQAPQTGLLALVDELLLAIIDQIDCRKALCNLSATCSRLQALTEPYIWRSLLVLSGRHAIRATLALDTREARTSYIHELSIRYQDQSREGIEELNHFVAMMDKLRYLTIESPCPNNTEWGQGRLVFDGWTRIDYPALFEASVYPRAGLPPALPMLQSLTLHGHGREDRKFVFGRAAVIFFHPTLQKITLSCTNFDAAITHANVSAEKRKSTPLRSLTLIECNVNVKFLDVVLSLPKALKELSIGERLYVFPDCKPSRDATTRTSDPLFLDALARQADSLEKLTHIGGRIDYLVHGLTAPETGGDKLCALKNLHFLELGLESSLIECLRQNDCPDSLKLLKLNDASCVYDWHCHPSHILRQAYYLVTRFLFRPIDIDILLNAHESEVILTSIDIGTGSATEAILGGRPIRSPVYDLASALQSRGCRLRLFANRFSSGKSYIPPYMYGEEVPKEVLFYDSNDFWRFSGRNFRIMDDEELRAEVRKKDKLECLQCKEKGMMCYNTGDAAVSCITCEWRSIGQCVYEGQNEGSKPASTDMSG